MGQKALIAMHEIDQPGTSKGEGRHTEIRCATVLHPRGASAPSKLGSSLRAGRGDPGPGRERSIRPGSGSLLAPRGPRAGEDVSEDRRVAPSQGFATFFGGADFSRRQSHDGAMMTQLRRAWRKL